MRNKQRQKCHKLVMTVWARFKEKEALLEASTSSQLNSHTHSHIRAKHNARRRSRNTSGKGKVINNEIIKTEDEIYDGLGARAETVWKMKKQTELRPMKTKQRGCERINVGWRVRIVTLLEWLQNYAMFELKVYCLLIIVKVPSF